MFRSNFLKIAVFALFISSILMLSCLNSPISSSKNDGEGSALLKIMATPDSPFQKIAKTAILTITAPDINTITKNLTITDSSVEGRITDIPVGRNRLFTVKIYDTVNIPQYYGKATSNVFPDSVVTINMTIARITGSVDINGNIIEDTSYLNGFRYYRFVVNTINLGGSNGAILTETHFIRGVTAYPPTGTYTVISNSSLVGGNILALFDGDSTTGPTTGSYVKFSSVPWEWILDMKQNYVFNSFYLSSWQTDFYAEPSNIIIYGSGSQYRVLGYK